MVDRRGAGPRVSASGTAAAGRAEQLLRQVTPGRYDAYEALLQALAEDRVWMLLWQGRAGSPDAQYGNMQVEGLGYAPCVTSAQELAVSGWTRTHEVVTGRDIARVLYPDRWGIWLNPHTPGGGVGIPGSTCAGSPPASTGCPRDRCGCRSRPSRSRSSTPSSPRTRTAPPRSGRCAAPGSSRLLGAPYLAIGLDLYDTSPASVDSVRTMMRQSVGAVPEGLPVSTVAMSDEYDPVTMWLRANTRPFYDREAHASPAPATGYGYPPPASRGY